jgi:hypothetical protein
MERNEFYRDMGCKKGRVLIGVIEGIELKRK